MKKQLLFELTQSLLRKMSFRITAFTVLTLLTVQSSFAQKWTVLGSGSGSISSGATLYTSIAVVNNGAVYTPYVAFTEATIGKVKKRLSDGTWSDVSTGLPGTAVTYTRLFSNSLGELFITYIDGSSTPVNRLAIKKLDFNDSTWKSINNDDANTLYVSTNSANPNTNSNFTSANRCSIVFDSSNTPYIAYVESNNPYLKKFDGTTWVNVGTQPISADVAISPDLALDSNGYPWVSYTKLATTGATTGSISLFGYNGSVWTDYSPSTPITSTRFTCISFKDTNTLYLGYANTSSSTRATIVACNKSLPAGTGWGLATAIGTNSASYISMIKDNSGNLYCAFRDAFTATPTKISPRVMFLGTSQSVWTELKDPSVTYGIEEQTLWPSIAIGNASYPYVAYSTNTTPTLATARVFDPLIKSSAVTAITSTTATAGGEVLSGATSVGTVTERGIVYGLTFNPTTADTKIVDGATTTGMYTSPITGLTDAVTYHVRAYLFLVTELFLKS
ncbi:hypothetical protein SAMN05443549_104116 [Flavobacterium fluvii]|uniref:Uncharacterized protein n=1 Tax=Flavobacterium fluvii TaxID=468056 RepID=A0A1M5JY43_9FLAO|nr:hypothetical protein [Flavobacterium fluvii]SHG45451.1 hypothetical protein SAMN05443549_104116 [Flavobacterium fluvii]